MWPLICWDEPMSSIVCFKYLLKACTNSHLKKCSDPKADIVRLKYCLPLLRRILGAAPSFSHSTLFSMSSLVTSLLSVLCILYFFCCIFAFLFSGCVSLVSIRSAPFFHVMTSPLSCGILAMWYDLNYRRLYFAAWMVPRFGFTGKNEEN